jgi:hypothetical protein
MAPDPRHCSDCDRRLDEPPPDGDRRIRRCPSCQADIGTYAEALGDLGTLAPRFGGVIALGAALPGWPTAITLLDLEIWGRFGELNIVEVPGPNPPAAHPRALHCSALGDQPPQAWTISTDVGTIHHGGGGGGGTPGTDRLLAWHTTIAPAPPERAGRFDVRAKAPGATSRTAIDLSTRPVTRRPASVELADTPADADPNCASCGPPPTVTAPPETDPGAGLGPELEWAIPVPPPPAPDACMIDDRRPICATCWSSRNAVFAAKHPTRSHPDRVVALGAELGLLFGSPLVIPSLTVWPTWFDLSIVGTGDGAWADGLNAFKRAGRWTAHDDHGHHYTGASTGGSGGLGLVRKNLSFIPTLAPDATTLSVTFPPSFDGRAHHATVALGTRT